MALTGIQLRTILRSTGEKMSNIREKAGLEESTFFWVCRQKVVPQKYIELFESLGYELVEPVDYATLQKLVKTLEDALEAERAASGLMRRQIEMLSAIITKGIESDYLFFNAVAAKIKKLPWVK